MKRSDVKVPKGARVRVSLWWVGRLSCQMARSTGWSVVWLSWSPNLARLASQSGGAVGRRPTDEDG